MDVQWSLSYKRQTKTRTDLQSPSYKRPARTRTFTDLRPATSHKKKAVHWSPSYKRPAMIMTYLWSSSYKFPTKKRTFNYLHPANVLHIDKDVQWSLSYNCTIMTRTNTDLHLWRQRQEQSLVSVFEQICWTSLQRQELLRNCKQRKPYKFFSFLQHANSCFKKLPSVHMSIVH